MGLRTWVEENEKTGAPNPNLGNLVGVPLARVPHRYWTEERIAKDSERIGKDSHKKKMKKSFEDSRVDGQFIFYNVDIEKY